MLAFDELKMLRQHVLTSDNNISILKHQMLKAELENKKLKRQLCKFSASFNQMKDALGTGLERLFPYDTIKLVLLFFNVYFKSHFLLILASLS